MAKESKEVKTTDCNCGAACTCGEQNLILRGFKIGFGFWLAALTVFLLVMAVSTVLYYIL